jgi:hypothetical protein
MSKDAEEAGSAARTSCPLCGNDKYTWGVAGGFHALMFTPDNAGFFSSPKKLKARRCDSCGNVQLFVAPE